MNEDTYQDFDTLEDILLAYQKTPFYFVFCNCLIKLNCNEFLENILKFNPNNQQS